MLKGKSRIAAAIIVELCLSAGTVVHASTLSDTTISNASIQVKQSTHKCKGNTGAVYRVLKNKLGFNDTEIENAVKEGKTAFDLAKTKGYTQDQLRTIIVEEQSNKIDEKVKEGKVTKETADKIKADFKTKMQSWDGSLKVKERYGMRHNAAYSVLKNKLGYTDSDIEKAVNDGKSAFDLAAAKKITAEQLKAMIIEEQSKNVDSAVSKGKITKEEGENMKSRLKSHMQNWDGSLKHKHIKNKEN